MGREGGGGREGGRGREREGLKSCLMHMIVVFSPSTSPSCLHTTLASMLSQKSSHTVPQWLLMHTSTRPSLGKNPPARRTDPLEQAKEGSEREGRRGGEIQDF